MSLPSISGGNGEPPEPEWSETYSRKADRDLASKEWGAVVREMKSAQILAVVNGHTIKRLVDFRLAYHKAAQHVAKYGALLAAKSKGGKGGDAGDTAKHAQVGQWNPNWSIMNKASEEIRQLEAALGISPTTRAKASKVDRAKKKPKASDEFLSAGRG